MFLSTGRWQFDKQISQQNTFVLFTMCCWKVMVSVTWISHFDNKHFGDNIAGSCLKATTTFERSQKHKAEWCWSDNITFRLMWKGLEIKGFTFLEIMTETNQQIWTYTAFSQVKVRSIQPSLQTVKIKTRVSPWHQISFKVDRSHENGKPQSSARYTAAECGRVTICSPRWEHKILGERWHWSPIAVTQTSHHVSGNNPCQTCIRSSRNFGKKIKRMR